MSFLHALRAEWIKTWSLRSSYVAASLIVIFSVVSSALAAWITRSVITQWGSAAATAVQENSLPVTQFFAGQTSIGLIIALIMAVTAITSEYSTSTIQSTFRGVPQRWKVFLAKLTVYSGILAVLSFVSAGLSILTAKLILLGVGKVDLGDADVLAYLWKLPVAFILITILSMGVAMIIHNTAGAISALVIWMLAIESVLIMLPGKAQDLYNYLPYQNLQHFLNSTAVESVLSWKWSAMASGGYFLGLSVLIFLIGLVVSDPNLRPRLGK